MNQVSKAPQPAFHTAGIKHVEQWMESYIDSGKSAGMLTLLCRNAEIAQLSCRGYADIASKRPIEGNTIFRIYSRKSVR